MRHLAAMAVMCLLAGAATAATYEAGTPEEFNARAAALKPGDELVVRDGVHTDWVLDVPAGGDQGRPVVIRPASPGGVLFRRGTAVTIKGSYVEFRGFNFEHCGPGVVVLIQGGHDDRVTECRFLYCGNPRSTFGHIVEVQDGSNDNRVDHCTFEGSKSMSIGLRITEAATAGQRNRFDHNVFRDIWRLSYNGQESIQLGQGGESGESEPHTLVEYNLFDNASGDLELISNKSSKNVIRYNVAANCRAALVIRGGNDCLVEGNVLAHNQDGIRVHGDRHVIINNICVGNADYGIAMPLGGGNHREARDCLVANNTLVDNGKGAIAFSKYSSNPELPKRIRILGNLLAGKTGTLLDLHGATDSQVAGNLFWPTGDAKVGFEGAGAILADPRLAGAGGIPRPAVGSPVIDAASALAEVVRDRLGRPRPAGKGPDVGADEVNAVGPAAVELPPVPPPRPPLAADALKGEAVLAYDPLEPMKGWERASGTAEPDNRTLKLQDAAIWLKDDLPADFVVEWEYLPAALEARAFITFAAARREGGYTLGFGGRLGKVPDGVVTLAKGGLKGLVADGHDTVLPNKPKDPIPNPPAKWYKCRLIKRGGDLRLEFAGTPVLLWNDTGVVGGPAPGAGGFGIRQAGAGTWRNLKVWRLAAGAGRSG
jgi:poly(beta-D-mannuronate) lyase